MKGFKETFARPIFAVGDIVVGVKSDGAAPLLKQDVDNVTGKKFEVIGVEKGFRKPNQVVKVKNIKTGEVSSINSSWFEKA